MSRKVKIVIITLLSVVSLVLAFGAGCTLGTSSTTPATVGPATANLGLDVVTEAWGIIFQDYVEKDKLDARVLSGGAIKGMVEALNDPYTTYLDVETYQLNSSNLEGKFEGIGAYVGIRDGKLMVIAPIPGSPADKAGIKAGDLILEVDGSATSEMSLEVAVLHIRGPRGTTVRLLILHQGEAGPEEINIVRQEIEVSSVLFEMKGDIAYININHFSGRTDEELSPVLKSVEQAAATGIILDLRSNPGGLLNEVVDVASHFLKEGVVVRVVDNQGNQSSLSVKPADVTTSLPMIMLADNFSASGSEVLAGALQDYGRAKLAGIKTYGKGSVNTLRRLKDGSGLYITIARWLTPNGRLIEGKGISPDYELELTGEDVIQWAIDYLKGNKR
ncbi:MAG: S41 family peptidase [Chloroflexi bacterium]|nr:S41 family peptidase [Chloroflexota bacterium]